MGCVHDSSRFRHVGDISIMVATIWQGGQEDLVVNVFVQIADVNVSSACPEAKENYRKQTHGSDAIEHSSQSVIPNLQQ